MRMAAPAVVGSALLLLVIGPAAADPATLVRPPVATSAALPGKVAAAVTKPFAAPGLGKRVAVTIVDAVSGQALYRKDGAAAVAPASTLKLVTAVTALSVLPADTRLRTTLVTSGTLSGGVLTGDLVLVGGGDTTLSSVDTRSYPQPARLSALAEAVRRRGITAVTGAIVVDASAYTGPATEPDWKPTYVTEGSVAPVTALMVDGGRARPGSTRGSRSAAPDIQAGQRFLALLTARGVRVRGVVRKGVAASGSEQIGVVESAPLPALVERMLQRSDNDLAEALLRRAARANGLPASFVGAAATANATLTKLLLPTAGIVLRDGSGLSRADRVTTDFLAAVIRRATASEHPELRPLLSGLPVSGFNGTLVRRYRDTATKGAAGEVRAKTGTLNNVTTLAGVVLTESGQLLVFSASADQVSSAAVGGAARLLDRGIAAVERCGCG